jgi:hypothetical protein
MTKRIVVANLDRWLLVVESPYYSQKEWKNSDFEKRKLDDWEAGEVRVQVMNLTQFGSCHFVRTYFNVNDLDALLDSNGWKFLIGEG